MAQTGMLTGDKVIVVAKTRHEDTSWVKTELEDWQSAVYTVDGAGDGSGSGGKPEDVAGLASSSSLTTPANKGHEAMAYLTYIVDNYETLPSILAFLHPHRSGFLAAWHTDTPLHSNVDALRMLNLTFVQTNGYVNLRCNWSPGCMEKDRDNAHVNFERWAEVFERTSTPHGSFPFPGQVAQACCAQFAVSKEAVLKRPRQDYKLMRNWLLTTELSDRKSGRVLEFMWHVIFGMDNIYCPEEKMCYCQVYGRC